MREANWNATFEPITYKPVEIQKLQIKADESLYKTAQFQLVIALVKATISRKENQKATEKSQKNKIFLCQEVSKLELLFTSLEKPL